MSRDSSPTIDDTAETVSVDPGLAGENDALEVITDDVPARRRGTRQRSRRTSHPRARTAAWAIGFFGLGLVALTLGERLLYYGKVLPNVEIRGVGASGTSEKHALKRVNDLAEDLSRKPLPVTAGPTKFSLDRKALNYQVDGPATVRAARRVGRTGNPLSHIGGFILRRFRKESVDLRVTYDEAVLGRQVSQWNAATNNGVEDGSLRFIGTDVIGVPPKVGIGIQRQPALDLLNVALRSGNQAKVALPMGPVSPAVDATEVSRAVAAAEAVLAEPVVVTVDGTAITLTPAQLAPTLTTVPVDRKLVLDLDRARLRAAFGNKLELLETAPIDATFTVASDNTVSVVPSVPGKVVDIDALAGQIANGQHAITAQLVAKEPVRDTAWAQGLNIRDHLATFETKHPPNQQRVTNIHKAADTLTGAIVEPGAIFSLNERLGERTLAKGYVPAPAIAADLGLEDSVGGGVSQVSTTLYNAAFFAGLEDVSHTPHAYYIDRYPAGREATLNYPSIDNKFRNNTASGILINVRYTATTISVSMFGRSDGRTVTAQGPNVLSTIPLETEIIDTPFLPLGVTKEVQKGHDGLRVEVFRVISRPNQPAVRERYVTKYAMVKAKIARGIGPAAPPIPPEQASPQPPPPGPTAPETTAPPATPPTAAPPQ